jgi:enoyl-CoA hydratase/carnithine racemase
VSARSKDAEEELHAADVMLKIRYASVPVVSAVRGLALGGGCELAVYSAKRVAAMESYIGLVEVGVGLMPGAGGLTYIARRAAENAATSDGHRPASLLDGRLHGRGHGEGGHGRDRVEASWATCSTAT